MRLLCACAMSALIVGAGSAWSQTPPPLDLGGGEPPVSSGLASTPSETDAGNALAQALDGGTSIEDSIPVDPQPALPAGSPIDRILDTQGGAPALSGQNVDPNQNLLTALQRARREGARLRVSPESVFLNIVAGNSGSEQIRINNLGDTTAKIRGVNAVAPIDGLLVTSGCGETLEPGAFCDIAVSYSSNTPREIFTAIVVGVEERDRSSIEIPVHINVQPDPAAAAANVPAPVDTTPVPEQIDPSDPRLAANRAPTSRDVARAYYGTLGGVEGPETGPMTIISLPENLRRQEEPYINTLESAIRVETIGQDPRYPDSVASTDATLPVDRSNIITADRVIKAVLDTPFSNVMCGKVVAVVESDVYSATSSRALIPSGSRVIGRCGSLVKERAGIVWERIITTDGRSVSLSGEDSMTRDANGLGGALGRVYRTPFDRYVLPLFGTFVDVGAGFVQAKYGENEEQSVTETGTVVQGTSARNEGIETATSALQERAQATIQEIADVREVLVVPAGTRIDIEIFEDIYFKDERQIIRLGDTVYDVASPTPAQAQITTPYGLALEPYRPGVEGPVVQVGGNRYILRESQGLAPIPGQEGEPGAPDLGLDSPSTPTGQGGRPVATSPTVSTQSTLDDLNAQGQ